MYGYNGADGMALAERAMTGVRVAASVAPAAFIIAAVAILIFYPISKEMNYRIGDELARRRDSRKEG
jgi:Na+/melibiose symporter-like transporter